MSRLLQLVDKQLKVYRDTSCAINDILQHTDRSKDNEVAFELIQSVSRIYNTTSSIDIEVYIKKLLSTGSTINESNRKNAAMSVVMNICIQLKLNMLIVNEQDILNGYREMLREPEAVLDEYLTRAFRVLKQEAVERNISDATKLM